MNSEIILTNLLRQAEVTCYIIKERYIKGKIPTKNGLCTIEIVSNIYADFYLIGPVIGEKGQPLQERKYFGHRDFLEACLYLKKCLES